MATWVSESNPPKRSFKWAEPLTFTAQKVESEWIRHQYPSPKITR